MSTSASEVARCRHVEGLPEPTGPYSWAVSFGALLFVSGLRGIEVDSGRPVGTDRERVRRIFVQLDAVLTAHGCSRGDVLSTRVYVVDMTALRPLVNEAYESYFTDAFPTRTIVEVARLNQDDRMEIEVVAARRPSG